MICKFKLETPKKNWIDEFVCLRSKIHSSKRGNDNKNKMKGISKSQSKLITFEEYYNCLFGGEYQKESDIFNIRPIILEMYLQVVNKSTLSFVDDKGYYINGTESKPWH